jgi:hypothetical protein
VSGSAYQAAPDEWQTGDSSNGWRCLKMSVSGTQRYQYGYEVGASTVGAGTGPSSSASSSSQFTMWARGDLDGDGRTSWFVMNGGVEDGEIVHSPGITVIDGRE